MSGMETPFRPDPDKAPDKAGEGRVTCSCGGLTIGPVRGWRDSSVTGRCAACGERIEVWP